MKKLLTLLGAISIVFGPYAQATPMHSCFSAYENKLVNGNFEAPACSTMKRASIAAGLCTAAGGVIWGFTQIDFGHDDHAMEISLVSILGGGLLLGCAVFAKFSFNCNQAKKAYSGQKEIRNSFYKAGSLMKDAELIEQGLPTNGHLELALDTVYDSLEEEFENVENIVPKDEIARKFSELNSILTFCPGDRVQSYEEVLNNIEQIVVLSYLGTEAAE